MRKIYICFVLFLTVFLISCGKKNTYMINLLGIKGHENENIITEYKIKKGDFLNLPDLLSSNETIEEKNLSSDEYSIVRKDIQYSFLGWVDKDNNDISSPFYPTKSIDIYADFYSNEIETKITYYLNGGYIDDEDVSSINEITKLSIPKREEYIFVGWMKNSSLVGSYFNELEVVFGQEYKFYAKYSYDPEILVKYIDELPDQISVNDVSTINYIREKYDEVSPSNKNLVINYEKFLSLEEQAKDLEDVIYLINLIDELDYVETKLAGNIKEVNEIDNLYAELDSEKQIIVNNYDIYVDIKKEIEILYNKYKDEAFDFDKKICVIPSYVGVNAKTKIETLYEEYLDLNENIISLLVCKDKMDLLIKELNKELEKSKLHFVTKINDNLNIYTSKEDLFKGFFTDFYFYICLYHGDKELINDKKYNVNDFVSLAADFNGDGVSNCYGIGNLAGRYMLVKDINGILENQPETGFLGFCYKNNLYEDIIPFLINFFAYWRIDEKYANLTNYGADTFAEAWAPTVDFAKFFYYDAETSYVKTDRMKDCFNNIAGVAYGIDGCKSIPSYVKLRGYKFDGWYDNPEFKGNPITGVDYNKINDLVLYAKFSVDSNQQNKDAAAFVDNYIYNLLPGPAVVNSTTVGYVLDMFNNLNIDAQKLVTKYNTLFEYVNIYCKG